MHIYVLLMENVIKRNLRVWYFCRITKSIDFTAGVIMSGSRPSTLQKFSSAFPLEDTFL